MYFIQNNNIFRKVSTLNERVQKVHFIVKWKKITLPKTCCEAFEVSILHKLLFAVENEIEM